MTIKKEIATNFVALIKKNGISQQDIANITNKSLSTISRYSRGKSSMPLDFLYEICSNYNLNIGDILPQNALEKRFTGFEEQIKHALIVLGNTLVASGNGEQKQLLKLILENFRATKP